MSPSQQSSDAGVTTNTVERDVLTTGSWVAEDFWMKSLAMVEVLLPACHGKKKQ